MPLDGGGRAASRPRRPTPGATQVHEGLVGLGWSAKDAERAVDAVAADLPADEPTPTDVAVLLRAALRTLSKA